jgi:dehydration protein DpgD
VTILPHDVARDERRTVLYRKDGHVARVTLNRPEVLNAMNDDMHAALGDVWDAIEGDEDVWVVVLGGAGGRAFSVGQDLKELAARQAMPGHESPTFGSFGRSGWPRLTERFDFSKPVVARVDGYALGGGFELALACDVVIASDRSVFALPEVRHGMVPGAGGVFRLTRQAPFRAAMGLLLTGRRLDANGALALGLVNEVVPPGSLDDCVAGWVDDILAAAPLAVRAVKEAAHRSHTVSLAVAFDMQYESETLRRRSEDAREGPRAFAEKRRPEWRGL